MLVIITAADINCRRIQVRGKVRNITAGAGGLLKAKAAYKICEVGIVTVIENSIIGATAVHFHNIMNRWDNAAFGKFPGADTASLFIFTKENMAGSLLYNFKNHTDTTPVISANSFRRHNDFSIIAIADMFDRLPVYRIQMGYQ